MVTEILKKSDSKMGTYKGSMTGIKIYMKFGT